KGSVKALVNFASKKNADLIVCATRAKKGLDRFLLGSFAESLMLQSTIPNLFINPFVTGGVQFKRILYSTDFSKQSKSVWKDFVAFAKTISAELVLFHSVQDPLNFKAKKIHPLL